MFKTPEKPKPEKNFPSWISATISAISLLLTFVVGIVHIDGRILRLEEQSSDIRSDLGEIKDSIEKNIYPRKEAELTHQLTQQQLQLINQRIDKVDPR